MKENISIITAGLFALLLTSSVSSASEMTKVKKNYSQNIECGTKLFPHSQTEAPCEGDNSPFDASTTKNEIFHWWSWQKFLWLTKPMKNKEPLFENYLSLVDNNMVPVEPIKDISLVLTDVTQAGSAGVLISNPEYSKDKKSYTVHYSIHTNSILQESATAYKNIIIKNQSKVDNQYVFPVGSLEVKMSWINENAIPLNEQKNYYITDAIVQDKKEKVALLGMHVVGVVKNHPEFIWATFEHKGMAPLFRFSYPDQGSGYLHPVTSADQKLFYTKGHYGQNSDIQFDKKTEAHPQDVFTLFEYGIPKYTFGSPGSRGIFTKSSQEEPLNYNNIQSINSYVDKNLSGVWQNYFYNGSIWIDTDGLSEPQIAKKITSLGYNIGNVGINDSARGSTAAFNITMETFFQSSANARLKNIPIDDINNCFTCHGSKTSIKFGINDKVDGNSPLYLSHIFRRLLSKSTEVSEKDIESLRIKDFKQVQ